MPFIHLFSFLAVLIALLGPTYNSVTGVLINDTAPASNFFKAQGSAHPVIKTSSSIIGLNLKVTLNYSELPENSSVCLDHSWVVTSIGELKADHLHCGVTSQTGDISFTLAPPELKAANRAANLRVNVALTGDGVMPQIDFIDFSN